MRSQHPDPNQPWPHDMVLSIDTAPQAAALLLFVRDAWQLDIPGIPALDPAPDVGMTARPPGLDDAELTEQWRHDWAQVWQQFEPRNNGVWAPDARTQFLLDTLSDEELWEVMSAEPSRLWNEGRDENAYTAWFFSLRSDISMPVTETPERLSLDAVIEAWRAGLTHIIEVPFAGYYAVRLSPSHLVVSIATRADPELYRRALAEPIES